MIPEELIQLIDKYCQGLVPTRAQEDEINDKVFELGADPMEVFSYIEEVKSKKSKAELEETDRIMNAMAERDAANVEIAAARASATIAEADLARQKVDEIKESNERQRLILVDKRNKKRTYIVFAIIISIIVILSLVLVAHLYFGKSTVQMASEAIYNAIESRDDIDDIDVDTSMIPSDDPSVIIDPQKDIKSQLEMYYQTVHELQGGFYKIMKDSKYGLADKTGKIIQKPKYDYIYWKNNNGLIKVENNKHFGFLNIKGVEIAEPIYSSFSEPDNGLIKVEIDGKYGFLNANTYKVVTPCVYSYIYSLDEGKYKVIQDKKIGYLNSDGTVLQAPK